MATLIPGEGSIARSIPRLFTWWASHGSTHPTGLSLPFVAIPEPDAVRFGGQPYRDDRDGREGDQVERDSPGLAVGPLEQGHANEGGHASGQGGRQLIAER